MALKLRINRQARAEEQRLREEYGDFRYAIEETAYFDIRKKWNSRTRFDNCLGT